MLTRKDYIKLAYILKKALGNSYYAGGDAGYVYSIEDLAADICDWLQTDNPRFDRDTFKAACGL